MNAECVKAAFVEVREGRSPEFVICDGALNDMFLAAARRRGVKGNDAAINTALINLRKQNKLIDCVTTRRKKRDPDLSRYRNVVLNAARFVERQFGENVDDVICDPETRSQFDAIIQFPSPATSAFEAQFAALNLRKSSRLKPEPVGQVIRAVASDIFSLSDVEDRLTELPKGPGVYLFFDEGATLYAGKADNLRKRIGTHIATWTFRELIRQIRHRQRPEAFLVFHELAVTISSKELTACETELIRSRKPAHNRAGASSR